MSNKKKTNTEEKELKEQNGKIYNLKDDIIFKAFFSRKGNEEFLIDFLKALLKIDIKSIEIREEVNIEQLKPEEKGGRLDLQAKLNNGVIVNIELQVENEYNIEKRTAYYSSKVLARETKRGTKYKDIDQVIMINILNYELLGFDEYISKTAIVLDKHREFEVIKNLQWYFIELPKFRKAHPDMDEKINQWLAFMDDYDKGLIKMAEKKNPTLKKAREEITYLTGDAAVQRLEELREKWEMDRISAIDFAEERGKKAGEENKQKEIAKKMLEKNIAIDVIIEVTGLSKEEIEKLQ